MLDESGGVKRARESTVRGEGMRSARSPVRRSIAPLSLGAAIALGAGCAAEQIVVAPPSVQDLLVCSPVTTDTGEWRTFDNALRANLVTAGYKVTTDCHQRYDLLLGWSGQNGNKVGGDWVATYQANVQGAGRRVVAAAECTGGMHECALRMANQLTAAPQLTSYVKVKAAPASASAAPAANADTLIGKPIIGLVYAQADQTKCIIESVRRGYPAEKAGFRKGDVIVRIGPTPVTDWKSCTGAALATKIGEPVVWLVRRGAAEVPVTVSAIARPALAEIEKAEILPLDPPAPDAPAGRALATSTPQRTAFALVIGIEAYRDIPPPPGAKADAEAFAAMLKSTLGLPDSNVRMAIDGRATARDFERHLAWLKANVPAGGRVYFFFSGHGAPDAAKGTSYLVPYDGDAQAIEETSIPLDKVLAALGETKAKDTVAFVDACFSGGGGRSILPKGARPLVKLKDVSGPGAVALFAASSGAQISGPSQEGKNGAFTKFLLQAIGEAKADINGDGQLTLQELAEWVTPRVEREAKQQSRDQTPKLTVGGKVGNPKDVAVAWGLK